MIRCNLAVLLAERQLRISRIAKDTGISRTTLTMLYGNASQGIQFETLDTLCRYLKVEPKDILLYCPINIEVSNMNFSKNQESVEVTLNVCGAGLDQECKLLGDCTYDFNDDWVSMTTTVELYLSEADASNEVLKKAFSYIKPIFLSEITKMLEKQFYQYCPLACVEDGIDVRLPYELLS